MREFVETNKRSKRSTEGLVCCNKVERHFFTTDMMRFWMDNGIQVEKIHKFYEYKPSTSVSKFVDTVTKHRRAADDDPALKCAGENFKLCGNSTYGE